MFERFGNLDTSIHLEDIPITPKNWLNQELATKWAAIRQVRRVVTGAIEVKRQGKVIGSSLEAAPSVYISDEELFEQITSIDFSEICITSAIGIKQGPVLDEMFILDDVDNVGVIFELAEGKKCERCWKYTDNFESESDYPDICGRCNSALKVQKTEL